MKKVLFAIILTVLIVSGCITTRKQRAKIVKTTLNEAHDKGGAMAVSLAIDALVLDGKLTAEQGTKLKGVLEVGFQKMITEIDNFAEK